MSYFALLDNNFDDDQAWLFEQPIDFVRCDQNGNVEQAFEKLRFARQQGFYAVGMMAYELGSRIEPAFASHIEGLEGDLLSFGIFRERKLLQGGEVDAFLMAKCEAHAPFVTKPQIGIEERDYYKAIAKIRAYLEAGDNYQVNYTFPTYFSVGGCLTRLYCALREAQKVKYGAYLNFPNGTILSRSPELFFKKTGDRLETHPMKGTEARDTQDALNDAKRKQRLLDDPKQRAENLMITDLLRNDLSRIAQKGSVKVEELFAIESYQTVHQMLSKISCKTDISIDIGEILKALYPCGSITGAPKIRTSEIIKELEAKPRGIYTGAIGYIAPSNDMSFSVPIRTLIVDEKRNGVMNIGSGIVYDSIEKAEFEECLLKGRFLFDLKNDTKIIESFYADETGFRNRDEHLDRMESTAKKLGFTFDRESCLQSLAKLHVKSAKKIRIELDKEGGIFCEAVDLGAKMEGDPKVVISAHKTCPHDLVYRFKTSNRGLYNREFAKAKAMGAVDVIFFNHDGWLTEGAIHNVFLRRGDEWLTPSIDCGLLAGIGRAKFIAKHSALERKLSAEDVFSADEIWLVSSTRGAQKVTISSDELLD